MSPLARAGGFPARFSGWCDECDGRIEVDELIRDCGTGKFVHVECPELAEEKPGKWDSTTLEGMGF